MFSLSGLTNRDHSCGTRTDSCALVICQHSKRPVPGTADVPQEIRLWVGGMSPALRDYEVALFKEALLRTAKPSRPYQVTLLHRPMSAQRSKIETERGTNVHAHFTSTWYGDFVDSNNVHLLHYPFFQNKLGLRKCLTREKNLPHFKNVKSIEALKTLKLGQQRSWIDVEIYSRNGIPVVEATDFENLFRMMERDRFDCLPLSVLEIDKVLEEQKKNHPDLVVVPDLYIFYPIPVFLSVSRFQQGLADRLDHGLSILFKDGTALRMFEQHYKSVDMHVEDSSDRLIVLENPLMSKEQNEAVIQRFLNGVNVASAP